MNKSRKDSTEEESGLIRCRKCGFSNRAGLRYCAQCGAALGTSAVPVISERELHSSGQLIEQAAGKKKHHLLIALAAGLVLAAAIAAAVFLMPVRVDLSDYTTVGISGCNHHGYPSVSIDKAGLVQKLYDIGVRKRVLHSGSTTMEEKTAEIQTVLPDFNPDTSFGWTMDHTEDIANGEMLTLLCKSLCQVLIKETLTV